MSSELLHVARRIALEAGELAAERRRAGVEVAATKSSIVDVVTQADRDVEQLIRDRIAEARPGDAHPRRRGRLDRRHERRHLGGRPDRRHRQLPVRHPALRDQHRRRRGRTRPAHLDGARRRRAQPGRRRAVHRVPWRRRLPRRPARSGSRMRCRSRRRSSAPASPTTPPRAAARARSWPGCCRGCATSAATAPPRSISRSSRAGASTPTSSALLNPWDFGAGALIAEEAGAVIRGLDGAPPSRDFLITGHPDVVGPLEELLLELGV